MTWSRARTARIRSSGTKGTTRSAAARGSTCWMAAPVPTRVMPAARAPSGASASSRSLAWSAVLGLSLELRAHRVDVEVGSRHLGVHALQRIDEEIGHGPVAVPLAIRGDDVPRRFERGAACERVLVRGLEVIPSVAVVQVVGVELPYLVGIVESREQPLTLLLLRDVQEEFQHGRAGLGEFSLERVDVAEAGGPHAGRGELLDTDDDDVLVVGTVEDADAARLGGCPSDAPEEIVRTLLFGRRLERLDVGRRR